jgi:hypothetical protein
MQELPQGSPVFKERLQLTVKSGQTKEEFVVSREKMTEFKKWIDR